jgi:hypothetical protein
MKNKCCAARRRASAPIFRRTSSGLESREQALIFRAERGELGCGIALCRLHFRDELIAEAGEGDGAVWYAQSEALWRGNVTRRLRGKCRAGRSRSCLRCSQSEETCSRSNASEETWERWKFAGDGRNCGARAKLDYRGSGAAADISAIPLSGQSFAHTCFLLRRSPSHREARLLHSFEPSARARESQSFAPRASALRSRIDSRLSS